MKELFASHLFYTWDADRCPVLEVDSGEEIRIEVKDCFSGTLENTLSFEPVPGEVNTELLNPLTGPVYIRGAMPGDVLAVTVMKIELNPWSLVANRGGCGLLGEKFSETTYKYLPIVDKEIIFDERLRIPVSPMAGVIGVTPRKPISTRKMGNWGGNMDNNKVTDGAVLYLPVEVEGALLAAGDLHAAMGDGEINGSGMESGGYITLKIEVRKNLTFTRPAVLDESHFYTTATAAAAEEAMRYTCEDMFRFFKENTSLPPDAIGMLMTSVGNSEVCVACGSDSKTFRFSMPRYVLEAYGIDFL